MKSATSIEQSLELLKYASIDSCDMFYRGYENDGKWEYEKIPEFAFMSKWNGHEDEVIVIYNPEICKETIHNIPAWSIDALSSMIPEFKVVKYPHSSMYRCEVQKNEQTLKTDFHHNLIDALYEAVIMFLSDSQTDDKNKEESLNKWFYEKFRIV